MGVRKARFLKVRSIQTIEMSDVIGLYSNIFNATHVAINNISIFSDSVAERFDDAIRSLEKNKRDCDCIATDLNTGFSNECKHFLR